MSNVISKVTIQDGVKELLSPGINTRVHFAPGRIIEYVPPHNAYHALKDGRDCTIRAIILKNSISPGNRRYRSKMANQSRFLNYFKPVKEKSKDV